MGQETLVLLLGPVESASRNGQVLLHQRVGRGQAFDLGLHIGNRCAEKVDSIVVLFHLPAMNLNEFLTMIEQGDFKLDRNYYIFVI